MAGYHKKYVGYNPDQLHLAVNQGLSWHDSNGYTGSFQMGQLHISSIADLIFRTAMGCLTFYDLEAPITYKKVDMIPFMYISWGMCDSETKEIEIVCQFVNAHNIAGYSAIYNL